MATQFCLEASPKAYAFEDDGILASIQVNFIHDASNKNSYGKVTHTTIEARGKRIAIRLFLGHIKLFALIQGNHRRLV